MIYRLKVDSFELEKYFFPYSIKSSFMYLNKIGAFALYKVQISQSDTLFETLLERHSEGYLLEFCAWALYL